MDKTFTMHMYQPFTGIAVFYKIQTPSVVPVRHILADRWNTFIWQMRRVMMKGKFLLHLDENSKPFTPLTGSTDTQISPSNTAD